jgi:transcriptional antiterminator NusG
MDAQEPEDKLEEQAMDEEQTPLTPQAEVEPASIPDPEPDAPSESPPASDAPSADSLEALQKTEMIEEGSPVQPAPEPDDEAEEDVEPAASAETDASSDEAAVNEQDSENEADEALVEPEQASEPPAERAEVAPIRDPEPVARQEAGSSSNLPAIEGAPEGPAWYVVHCYSGYENKVRHNLEQRIETMGMKDKIFDVVIPTQEEIEVKEGKRRTVERHIFPGYVLVNMALSEESWYVVRNTPGVTGFVGMGNQPTPLRPEEVSQIIKRMEAEAPTVKVTFKVGERVRIVDGPFNDFRGVVAEIDMERTKVRVMVSFFGRETPVELDFLQVEKA